jgi:hypothetical protein
LVRDMLGTVHIITKYDVIEAIGWENLHIANN